MRRRPSQPPVRSRLRSMTEWVGGTTTTGIVVRGGISRLSSAAPCSGFCSVRPSDQTVGRPSLTGRGDPEVPFAAASRATSAVGRRLRPGDRDRHGTKRTRGPHVQMARRLAQRPVRGRSVPEAPANHANSGSLRPTRRGQKPLLSCAFGATPLVSASAGIGPSQPEKREVTGRHRSRPPEKRRSAGVRGHWEGGRCFRSATSVPLRSGA